MVGTCENPTARSRDIGLPLLQKTLSLFPKIKLNAMPTPQINNPTPRPLIGKKPPKQAPAREELQPMTMEEYRAGILRSIEDYHAGRVISQEEMEKRIASWISR
jgi:hypothetical protein